MKIIDNNDLLSKDQLELLQTTANLSFNIGGYTSLNDILETLNVDVYVEPGTPQRNYSDYLKEAKEFWRKRMEELKKLAQKDESLRAENNKAEILFSYSTNVKAYRSMSLLGVFVPDENRIILYPEAMKTAAATAAAKMSGIEEFLVTTFAHEVMHAYFNRQGHENYPYALFVEEPLAEFGMLLFLYENTHVYYRWAYNNVKSKKTCYRFGAALMEDYLKGNDTHRDYLEAYKIEVHQFDGIYKDGGKVVLPSQSPIKVAGGSVLPIWNELCVSPKYFWDEQTRTLGLDGYWGDMLAVRKRLVDIFIHSSKIENVYLGDSFSTEGCVRRKFSGVFSRARITMSVKNQFYELKVIENEEDSSVLVEKTSNEPVLKMCGEGLYKLRRNNKWGVVKMDTDKIVKVGKMEYDHIWSFKGNRCMVKKEDNEKIVYGFINKKGDFSIDNDVTKTSVVDCANKK